VVSTQRILLLNRPSTHDHLLNISLELGRSVQYWIFVQSGWL